MTLDQIYTWLLANLPESNSNIRAAWSNMASYCYFRNTIDFQSSDPRLNAVLRIAKAHQIQVPDNRHETILKISASVHSEVESIGNGQ